MEQRKFPRSKLATLIKVADNEKVFLGETIDISQHGMSCELAVELKEARPLLLSFRLNPKDKPITIWATPIWTVASQNKYKTGFKFDELDSNSYTRISDFIAASWLNTTGSLQPKSA
jgi:hypothetical protein